MADQRPHIVLIMTDQQRFDTIGAWDCEYMITPHMDRLAGSGVSFRQAFCPGATCVASRAAMFTGMYAHNTGAYSFDQWARHRNWVQDLAEGGYRCVNIGKMHFTPRDVPGGFHERVVVENPTNNTHANGGVDDDWGRYLSFHGQERPNDRNKTDPEWLQKYQGVPWHLAERFHSDVFIGDSAVSWIDDHRGDAPVFLQVGFTGPHEPWDPLPRHLELYADVEMPQRVYRRGELDDKPPQHEGHKKMHATTGHESVIDMYSPTEDDIARMRRHYYAKITTVDEQVGRVLEALQGRGWLENSLVVFCSDHGELLGDHTLAYKWLMYDPIVHVPLIVWDGRRGAAPGRVDELVSLMDVGPTLLEAAGIEVPSYLEGRSLRGYLDAEAEPPSPREFVYCEDNYQIMMRSPTHKLVYYIGQEQGELYDLQADADELSNLWDSLPHREVRNALVARLLEWLAASVYYNAGYKQDGRRQYGMRWPAPDDPFLHGSMARNKPRQSEL